MKYLKIRAGSYNEAMMKLKMEYGDDAIPISHKNIKEGGFFNSRLLGRDIVELTAAIQERGREPALQKGKKGNIDFTIGNSQIGKGKNDYKIADDKSRDSISSIRQREESVNEMSKERDSLESSHTTEELLNFFRNKAKTEMSMEDLKVEKKTDEQIPLTGLDNKDSNSIVEISKKEYNSYKKLECDLEEIKEKLNRLFESNGNDVEKLPGINKDEDKVIQPYLEILVKNDFDHDDCITMLRNVKNTISRDDLKDRYKIEKSLKELLKSRIVVAGPINPGNKKKIVMFFGPTGVGKTTTMAKLGAIYALREGYRVSFITIDNYRIAATEQLKKYSEIMKIPIYVVNDQKDFREKIEKEKSDIIMVDTSGRSHRNELKISEIKSYADMVECDLEKILCVSANTKKIDLAEVFKAFDKISFDSIIITKVDETSFIGNVIDVADKYNKPISYYTDGQEVPNDITIADPDKLVNMILDGINS